ncbi:MAG: hypothetical protein U0441_37140 [Polyangiaceae bacterium]
MIGVTGVLAVALSAVCVRPEIVAPSAPAPVSPVATVAEDTTHKEDVRLVPVEAYIRTYLTLFGGLAPLPVERRARGADGALLFDAWNDYLTALGLPDHRIDLPRSSQTNAIMLGAFERLGAALCDRAMEHDWQSSPPVPVEKRLIFAFDGAGASLSRAEFASRFDVLHRTFLGYPAALAPTDRVARYHRLFGQIVSRHDAKDAPKSRIPPEQIGWVAVCEGLVRHPEFHFY